MMCQIGIPQSHLIGLDLKDFFLELHLSTWDSEGININTHSCILSARIPVCPVSDHSCILSARIPICPVSDHFLPPLSEHSLPPLSKHFLSPFSKHFLPPLSEDSLPPLNAINPQVSIQREYSVTHHWIPGIPVEAFAASSLHHEHKRCRNQRVCHKHATDGVSLAMLLSSLISPKEP